MTGLLGGLSTGVCNLACFPPMRILGEMTRKRRSSRRSPALSTAEYLHWPLLHSRSWLRRSLSISVGLSASLTAFIVADFTQRRPRPTRLSFVHLYIAGLSSLSLHLSVSRVFAGIHGRLLVSAPVWSVAALSIVSLLRAGPSV